MVDGAAKSVRVIGKGNRERMVPLPESFGQVFGFWLNDNGLISGRSPTQFGSTPQPTTPLGPRPPETRKRPET